MGKKRFLEDKVDRLSEMFPVVAMVGPRHSVCTDYPTASQLLMMGKVVRLR